MDNVSMRICVDKKVDRAVVRLCGSISDIRLINRHGVGIIPNA